VEKGIEGVESLTPRIQKKLTLHLFSLNKHNPRIEQAKKCWIFAKLWNQSQATICYILPKSCSHELRDVLNPHSFISLLGSKPTASGSHPDRDGT